jgi:hypothetical protein
MKNSFLAEHVPLLLHSPTAIPPATSSATTIPNNNNFNGQFIAPSPTHYKSSISSSSTQESPTKLIVAPQAINGGNLSPLQSMRGRLTIAQIKQNKTSDIQDNFILVVDKKSAGKKKKKTSQL